MTAPDQQHALRALPAIDAVIGEPGLAAAVAEYGRPAAVDAARAVLEAARAAIRAGEHADTAGPSLAARVAADLARRATPRLKPVFNLTGTVLHTNLGRAPLADAARAAVDRAAGACNVEYDLERGARGQRDALVEAKLCALTGAEGAIVVNNNAAAVLLVLNALAQRRETILSRGELIEIGDSFRMPDIMTRAGTVLREVGTTNRTHARDYEDAVNAETALLMRVYPSNYVVEGFAGTVADADLAEIAHARDLPLAIDLGSGSLIELADYGLPHEPTPRESLAAGADIVMFSGDKLLGGPQSGLIVGTRDWIETIRRSPLKRALRCDKLILAALEATLALYTDPARLAERLPALRLLSRDYDAIRASARTVLAPARVALAPATDRVELVDCRSQIGSGSLPVDRLPSVALALAPPAGCEHPGVFLRDLAAALRALPVPVIGRVHRDRLMLDLRCLEDPGAFIGDLAALAWPPPTADNSGG